MRAAWTYGLVALLAACVPPGQLSPQALGEPDGGARFENVPDDTLDPYQVVFLPPSVASRMHSCQKIRYAALGNLLASRGVNLQAVAPMGSPPTAGQIYKAGGPTLGAPNYATRTREATQATTSGATKLMDVFLMAAPEIIAAMPNLAACKIMGKPTSMFDGNGLCTAEGILCLTGAPVAQAQIDLCNQLVTKDVPSATGRQIAVAAILSAAHTCE